MAKSEKVVMKTVEKQLGIQDISFTRELLIRMLDDVIVDVPEEFRSSVVFEVERHMETYSDDYHADMFMRYKRPENEVERAERLNKEQRLNELQEKRQREQYEELKKKFEGK
jgi:glycosylphosphatidylinositol transamidase (GPIT) subunit GPI8